MIGILLTAVLSNSTGQVQNCGPVCSQGSYCALIGTYIGPYPTTSFCAQTMPGYGYTPGYAGGYGGGNGMPLGCGGYPGGFGAGMGSQGMVCGPPIILPPGYSLVKDEEKSKENTKEHKEIQRQLDEIKGALEKDVKGTLDKLTESLKQTDKRLESTEKIGIETEAQVKWLKEQVKERLFWHDMESKLDQRIKPIEEKLRDFSKSLEKHDEHMRRQHEELLRGQPGGARSDGFKSIESKIESLQGTILKEVSSVLLRLEELEESLKLERALRAKIEDRLKNVEKSLTPNSKEEPKDKAAPKEDKKETPKDEKKEAPKDKGEAPKEDKKEAPKEKEGGAIGLSKTRVAQVSLTREGVPVNRALVVVSLPADASLYLNDQLTRAGGATRSFVTPELEAGGTFTYTFRMELFENGALRTQTQQVYFQPGRRVAVVFGSSHGVNVAGAQK